VNVEEEEEEDVVAEDNDEMEGDDGLLAKKASYDGDITTGGVCMSGGV
jgi:hypothetical protein